MTNYRYVFGSLRDERIIAEIPLSGTFADLALNNGGRFDGSFHLDTIGRTVADKARNNQIMLDATVPGRTFVAVERNNDPIWIGFVWSRTYQSQSKSVQMFSQSFENYPEYQLIRNDFVHTDEQLTLFKDLWTTMQSVPGRNINVLVPSIVPPTLVVKEANAVPSDFKFYNEVMSGLADTSDGFDWYIGVSRTGNVYNKQLLYGYPTLGTTLVNTLTFDYPGSILNYYATESMAEAGTHIYTVGAGEGSAMLTYESAQDLMVTQGAPRWDRVVPRKDIADQAQITGIGIQEGVKRKPPMLTLKCTFKGDKSPEFGSFGLGDTTRVTIKDARFPQGFTFTGRIIKWALQPTSAENTEEYNVWFAGDEEG